MLRVFDRLGYSKESLMQNTYLLFDCFEGPKNLEVRVLHKYEGTKFCIGFQIFLQVLQDIKLEVRMMKQVCLYFCHDDKNN